MGLKYGLPDEKLLSRIEHFAKACGLSERGLGFYLLDFDRRRLFKKYGFASTIHYAQGKLQITHKKTRELIRVARALEGLSLIDHAFSNGGVKWSAVREITRVAARETEKEWLEVAQKRSLRNVEQAVSRVSYGDRPPKDPYALSKVKLKVMAELATEDYAIWKAAFDRLAQTCGEDLDTATAILIMARMFLEKPLSQAEAEGRKAFQVVYHRCSECDRAWVQTDDGPQGAPAKKVKYYEQWADIINVKEDEGDPACIDLDTSDPTLNQAKKHMQTAECVPRGAPNSDCATLPQTSNVTAVKIDKPNTNTIRKQVLSRDGHCCAAPGCLNKRNLSAHHVAWRTHGGKTELRNEISLCPTCHSLVHEGIITVKGKAPHDIEWTRPDGKPLIINHSCTFD